MPPVPLQVTAQVGLAHYLVTTEVGDQRRFSIVTHRRQVTPARMAAPVIIPVLGHVKDVVQVPLAEHAEGVQHFGGDRTRTLELIRLVASASGQR